jgi:hypothetical protein
VCGEQHLAEPASKLKGHRHCVVGGGGITPDEKALTYLIYFHTIDLYKVGITGNTVKVRFGGETLPYEIVLERHFDLGADAMELEVLWLNNVQHLKVNTGELVSGNTETFRF